jgi:hypothetical protein
MHMQNACSPKSLRIKHVYGLQNDAQVKVGFGLAPRYFKNNDALLNLASETHARARARARSLSLSLSHTHTHVCACVSVCVCGSPASLSVALRLSIPPHPHSMCVCVCVLYVTDAFSAGIFLAAGLCHLLPEVQ